MILYSLCNDNNKIIAVGSYDAVLAAARLIFGPNIRLSDSKSETIDLASNKAMEDIMGECDEEWLADIDHYLPDIKI